MVKKTTTTKKKTLYIYIYIYQQQRRHVNSFITILISYNYFNWVSVMFPFSTARKMCGKQAGLWQIEKFG